MLHNRLPDVQNATVMTLSATVGLTLSREITNPQMRKMTLNILYEKDICLCQKVEMTPFCLPSAGVHRI